MQTLGIDIETYCADDLAACGVYRYAEDPTFEVLLFGYAVDGGAAHVVDVQAGEQLPADILAALTDPAVMKTAYNAAFERVCLGQWLQGRPFAPEQWQCTMARAAAMGFPLGLDACGAALGFDKDEAKLRQGRALVRRFCKPQPSGVRIRPQDDPQRWEMFRAYNMRDVEVEQHVLRLVRRLENPAWERRLWIADQHINDRGVALSRPLAERCARLDTEIKERAREELRRLTQLQNPNSPAQLKAWLARRTGMQVDSLNKTQQAYLRELLKDSRDVLRVLDLRAQMSRTSCAKYGAMLNAVCRDGRLRGLLQFAGAARTGRWAGRLVQLQNLPQNHLQDLDRARRTVLTGSLDDLDCDFADPADTLTQLIRTALVASEGRRLLVADFSAIEARVIAWLAGEEWVLDVFRHGGDIYCETASKMFGVPVEKHGRNAELRAKGKVATLALGYGGGVAALEAMGGQRLGLTKEEELDIVRKWRRANPKILRLWQLAEQAACAVVQGADPVRIHRGIQMERRWGCLVVTLPSGRKMVYPRARVEEERGGAFGGREGLTYEGCNQTTKQWERLRTYGGKLVENLVQATARDILGAVLLEAEARGMDVVFHVHDEIIVDAPPAVSLDDVCALFARAPKWADGLPLKGAGYETPYYLKD